jgi:hypothetical protein
MRDLEDLLSKLNPMAEEFILPSLASPVGPGVVRFRSCRKKGEGVRRPWLPREAPEQQRHH